MKDSQRRLGNEANATCSQATFSLSQDVICLMASPLLGRFLVSFNLQSAFLLSICRQFSKYKPPRGLHLEGRFNGGYFALPEGVIHGGAYFQNFTVMLQKMFKKFEDFLTLHMNRGHSTL